MLLFNSSVIVKSARKMEAWAQWCDPDLQTGAANLERVCYRGESSPNRFLELVAIEDWTTAELLCRRRKEFHARMEPLMETDWRQQVLGHVEAVKPWAGTLPRSRKLQVRYIEVPQALKAEYLEWRRSTIFAAVRDAPEVETFVAYQTLLSTSPGVIFFSGFSGDSELYMDRAFRTPRYQQIIRDAGSRYIAGGDSGLSTEIFVAA